MAIGTVNRVSAREVDEVQGAAQFAELMSALANEQARSQNLELAVEGLSDQMQLRNWDMYDSAGWDLLSSNGEFDHRGVPLNIVQKWATVNQQLVAINPMIKRGVQIRVSYIFGEGVLFGTTDPGRTPQSIQPAVDPNAPTKEPLQFGKRPPNAGTAKNAAKEVVGGTPQQGAPLDQPRTRRRKSPADAIIEKNKHVFSAHGYEQQEIAACTDGNLFYLLDKSDKSIVRVPISEITGIVTRSDDRETQLYIQRTWTEVKNNADATDPSAQQDVRKLWFQVVGTEYRTDRKRNEVTRTIKDGDGSIPVDPSRQMLHVAVNDQISWIWGVPDIQSVLFWAKSYKETLEANYTLVRALAKFTWKISNTTPQQTKRAAQRVATAAAIDPLTGRPSTAGGTAIAPGDTDLVAINKAGANVNFDAARPLAAMVAAGLEVSLIELLSDPSIGNQASAASLGIPTLKAMTRRQAIFRDAYKAMFDYFGVKVDPTFPPIQSEAIHRVIQAVVTAASTNALHPEEIREMLILALRAVGINPLDALPSAGQYAEYVTGINPQAAAQQANDLAIATADANAQAKADGVNNNAGTSPANTPKGAAKGKGRQPAGANSDGTHDNRKSEVMRSFLEVFADVDPADMTD